jgi:hypothetical protein
MTTFTEAAEFDIAIACSLSNEELRQRGAEFGHLFADAEDVAELPNGYALKFPNRDSWINRVAEMIIAERKCCPFFGFTLAFEPNGGPAWLHLVGPAGVKELIREQMVPAHLNHRRVQID